MAGIRPSHMEAESGYGEGDGESTLLPFTQTSSNGTGPQPAASPRRIRNRTLTPVTENVIALGLDPDAFHVPAKDHQGHYEKVTANVMPGYMTELVTILDSRVYPYTSIAEMVRHAIKRHVQWLRELAGQESPTLTMTVALEEVMRHEKFQQDFNGVFGKTQEIVTGYVREKQEGLAREFLGRVLATIESMEDSPRKFWYRTTFDDRFGIWMGRGEGS